MYRSNPVAHLNDIVKFKMVLVKAFLTHIPDFVFVVGSVFGAISNPNSNRIHESVTYVYKRWMWWANAINGRF